MITEKWRNRKLNSTKTDMFRSVSKQSGESMKGLVSHEEKKAKLRWEGFAEKEGFKK